MNEYIYYRTINTNDGDDAETDSVILRCKNIVAIVNRGIGGGTTTSGLDMFFKPVRNISAVGNEFIINDHLGFFTHHDMVKQSMEAIVTLINSKNEFNTAHLVDDVLQGEASGATDTNPYINPRLAKLPSIKNTIGQKLPDGTTVADPSFNNFGESSTIANQA
tara:strand:+ start:413 stop:901 length:489 start_codon:yes stop_codon:yes gene_type:complete